MTMLGTNTIPVITAVEDSQKERKESIRSGAVCYQGSQGEGGHNKFGGDLLLGRKEGRMIKGQASRAIGTPDEKEH
jgi:hypothetical protein